MDIVSPRARLGRWVMLALAFSLLFHVVVAGWFSVLRIAQLAIPAQADRFRPPLQVERVQINPAALEGAARVPLTPQPLAQAPQPGRILSGTGRTIQKAKQSARPQISVPPPPDPRSVSAEVTVPTSPFRFAKEAEIAAEVANFKVGPLASMPSSLGMPDVPIKIEGESTFPGWGSAGPQKGPPAAGDAGLPGFDEIASELQLPEPGLDPKLPEPVALSLQSDVLFDFDSAQLRPEAIPLMEEVLQRVEAFPTARVQVEGHTDTIGTETYNQKLSEARARAVQTWLSRRLPSSKFKLEARGFGERFPKTAADGDAEAQKQNRRVEIIIQALKL